MMGNHRSSRAPTNKRTAEARKLLLDLIYDTRERLDEIDAFTRLSLYAIEDLRKSMSARRRRAAHRLAYVLEHTASITRAAIAASEADLRALLQRV